MSDKPQLHYSGLDLLSKCGVAFERRYVLGERMPATSHIHVGKGVDQSANRNLSSKIETATLLPVAQVLDVARDAVRASIEKEGLALTPDEQGMTEAAAADGAVDKAVRLARAHAEKLAPKLHPQRVQAEWSLEIPGFPFDIVGTRDLDETDGTVRDLKTSKKSPNKNAAEVSDQLTLYSLAKYTIDKAMPPAVALDTIVDLKTGIKIDTKLSTRDKVDFTVMLNRLENAAVVLDKGAFTPARQSDWWCSLAWCPYAQTCRFFRKPKSVFIEGDE